MANSTEPPTVLEERDEIYTILMTIISVILLLFTTVAIIALRRTKSTPETARFLSSGLLLFDITGTLSFTLRRFVVNHYINIFVQVLGVNCVFIAYVTVGIMSFERLLIFSSPHFYLRRVTPEKVKRIVTSIWISLTVMYFFVRYGMCYTLYTNATIYDVIGRCNTASYTFYGFFIVMTCVVSGACYTRIFMIEWSNRKYKQSTNILDTFRALMKYKTTGIVFLYTVSILLTTLSYCFTLLFLKSDTYGTRISTDITNMTSCVLDPCLYVLWFRECRYEVLKMFSCASPKMAHKLENMRIEIFNVVLLDKNKVPNNKIEPLFTPDVIIQI